MFKDLRGGSFGNRPHFWGDGRLLDTIYALPFWPQMADHLLWGALLGAILHLRVQGR
jgi:hypothetical protein